MYRVGYNVGNNQFLELYRACFDTRAVRAIFVEHRVYGKPFCKYIYKSVSYILIIK